jgi:hypothetical protein
VDEGIIITENKAFTLKKFDFSNGKYYTIEVWYMGNKNTWEDNQNFFSLKRSTHQHLALKRAGGNMEMSWNSGPANIIPGGCTTLRSSWNYVAVSVAVDYADSSKAKICGFVLGNAEKYNCYVVAMGGSTDFDFGVGEYELHVGYKTNGTFGRIYFSDFPMYLEEFRQYS